MLMAREDANPASWLGGAAKRLLVLVFPSCEVANIDRNDLQGANSLDSESKRPIPLDL
jgi:hypothetical protein